YENTVVDIEGNTDSTGSPALNQSLSKERAEAVKRYLMEKYSFPSARMRTAGNGSNHPIAGKATPGGPGKKRRTDIKVYRNSIGSSALHPEKDFVGRTRWSASDRDVGQDCILRADFQSAFSAWRPVPNRPIVNMPAGYSPAPQSGV